MTDKTDENVRIITEALDKVDYTNVSSLKEASQIFRNNLMRENLRFFLACRAIEGVDASKAIDESIAELLTGAVTMAWADGIPLQNIMLAVMSIYKSRSSEMSSEGQTLN